MKSKGESNLISLYPQTLATGHGAETVAPTKAEPVSSKKDYQAKREQEGGKKKNVVPVMKPKKARSVKEWKVIYKALPVEDLP